MLFDAADPNVYSYVANDPVNLIDPAGLCAQQACDEPPPAPPGVSARDNVLEAGIRRDPFWFYDQVRNGGPWDYKQQGSEYEAFGNFNYGATGAATGFAPRFLLRQAGRAQIEAGTSRSGWGDPGAIWNPFGGEAPFGDDPIDQYWINRGIQYFLCMSQGGI